MPRSSSLEIRLTPDLERFLQSIVAAGLYSSASEAVQAGLRLLEGQGPVARQISEELRAKIAAGLEQANRGELLDGEAIVQELEERFGVALDAS